MTHKEAVESVRLFLADMGVLLADPRPLLMDAGVREHASHRYIAAVRGLKALAEGLFEAD